MVPSRPDVERRHRERRQQTHGRILEAARVLLEGVPWSAISVDRISERVGLSRTAFYKHFADRRALLLALLDEADAHFETAVVPWLEDESSDPAHVLRQALATLARIYHDHGRLLRALADEASQDHEFGVRYVEIGKRLSSQIAARIAKDVAAGRSAVADPFEVATALVWLNERHLLFRFGRPPLGDPRRVADGLAEVWIPTVYGGADPKSPPPGVHA